MLNRQGKPIDEYRYPYITKTGKLVYVRGLKGYMAAELRENGDLRLYQSKVKGKEGE